MFSGLPRYTMTPSSQTLVIKIGTSSLTRPENGQLALSTIAALVETLCALVQQGHRVVLVSSGAVGVGCSRLGITERPQKMAVKQAIAAVGQGRLMRIYDDCFSNLQQPIAQILLTRRELTERNAYVNAYNTFQALFDLNIIPIVNENDTVAVEELKFGDNDTLSALVASLVEANWLFLLTDVDQLYSSDPRLQPDARPIPIVTASELEQLNVETRSTGSAWGTGGMQTKITAARIASGSGVRTVITHGQKPQALLDILQGAPLGTQFEAQPRPDNARKRWISYGLVPTGKIVVDTGAIHALKTSGKSLLAIGVVRTEGEFNAAEAVIICDAEGQEIGRGLCNYSHQELAKIKGLHSEAIATILGYDGPNTVIHRDNLVLND